METNGILRSLLSRFITEEPLHNYSPSPTYEQIAKTSIFIEQNLKNQLTVAQLAERCHVHVDYFSRVFTEIYGIRPSEYIQQKRIQRAQTYLSTTSMTSSEIAHKVGLSNISYFNRLFKKITGATPTEYRKQPWLH